MTTQHTMPGTAAGIGPEKGEIVMDATRRRRTLDGARHRWYAYSRSFRFARHCRFNPLVKEPCSGFAIRPDDSNRPALETDPTRPIIA